MQVLHNGADFVYKDIVAEVLSQEVPFLCQSVSLDYDVGTNVLLIHERFY